MHPLAKKLLVAKQLRLDEGDVSVLGSESLILPYQTILDIEEYVPKEKIYELGERSGSLIIKALKKLGLSSAKLESFSLDLLSMDGWGKFKVLKNMRTESILHVENSLQAKDAFRERGKEAKCHFLAGMIGAIWASSYNGTFVVHETKCLGQGHPVCEFVIKSA